MQRVRIKQWLLLLLRTMALACVIAAIARPVLKSSVGGAFMGSGFQSLVLIVDNSLSMTIRDAGGGYLEQMRSVASQIVESTKQGDEIFVMTMAAAKESPAHASSRTALAAIDDIEAQAAVTTVQQALWRASALLRAKASYLNREIVVLGDLQRSMLLDTLEAPPQEGARVLLIPAGEEAPSNVSVTGVEITSRLVEPGQPVRIAATLANYGEEDISGYVASLYLGGERIAQASADLSARSRATVDFTITPQARGWLSGAVRIEDDAFAEDNRHFFTLHVPETRRILVVRGPGERTDFVDLALSSRLARGKPSLEPRTIEAAELTSTPLGGQDAVLLVGPGILSTGEIAALTRYVEGGGGLFLFPGESRNPEEFNALLEALGGGHVSGFAGALEGRAPIATFAKVDLEHPLFEGVFEKATPGTAPVVERADVYYAASYAPRSISESTLIELSNGSPFLQEIRTGSGVSFVLAVAPNIAWSDLPVRGLFAPLLIRSIHYLSAGESVQGAPLVAGRRASVRLAGAGRSAMAHIVTPGGYEIIPEQQHLFGATLLELGATLEAPGIYDVMVGDALVRRLPLNIDGRESDLAAYAPEEAAERLAEATGLPVRVVGAAAAASGRLLKAERTELWNAFLILALSCLVAEMFVSMRWRSDAPRAKRSHPRPA